MQVYPAIECVQNEKRFYIAKLNSEVLKKMCYISRRNEEPETGFQRLLNEGRAKKIANYLDKENGLIPSALILSVQPDAKFKYDEEKLSIEFEIVEEGFLVIDGQHRLYGLLKAEESYDIPVVIFKDLGLEKEVRLFIDINTTQKGVSSALLLDIKALAGRENQIEENQRILFEKLDKSSPLSGYLSSSSSGVGKISRTAFNAATKTIFEDGPLREESIDIIYKAVKNYLSAVELTFEDNKSKDARINKGIIFAAIFEIFNDICSSTLQTYGNLKIESIKKVIEPIAELDYESYKGTSKAVIKKIVNDMNQSLSRRIIQASEDMF